MNNLLESESLTKQNNNLRLQLLKGLFGPWKGDKEATDGFVCMYRTRQRTTFKRLLNQQLFVLSRSMGCVVCHMNGRIRGSGEWPEKLGCVIPIHQGQHRRSDMDVCCLLCYGSVETSFLLPCHMTPVGEDKRRPRVTSIILSPAPAIFMVSLFSPHNWTAATAGCYFSDCFSPRPSWASVTLDSNSSVGIFFCTRLSDSLTPAQCPTVQLDLTVCTWREREIL